LDGNFQANYQAAERAYGGGDYETAHHLASELLKQLESQDQSNDDQLRDAVLGWRPFVTLLLGHIELHGLQRPDQAVGYYQLALDCQPQDTLAELAKQGLERSQNISAEAVEPITVELKVRTMPSILQDPFLSKTSPPSAPVQAQETAMPWLNEINPSPTSTAESAPTTGPAHASNLSYPPREEQKLQENISVEAEQNEEQKAAPAINKTLDREPAQPTQSLPLIIPEETIEKAWIRISLAPNITKMETIPVDKNKSLALLQHLKQAFARRSKK
jgi:tetratricopeptide (TPR) repeat protein